MPDCFGGDAVYSVLASRLWSKNVKFVAPIGNDFPKHLLNKLHDSGLDLEGMPIRNLPVIRNTVEYKKNGGRHWTLHTDPKNFFPLSPSPEDIPKHFLLSRAFLILAMDLMAQEKLAPFLKSLGRLVALDPQEDYIPGNEQRLLNLLRYVDIFLPSQDEIQLLLKHSDYFRAAKELANLGPKIIVIKLGVNGSLIFDSENDHFIKIPIFPTNAIDTTGAGDSYCGGFMTEYPNENDLVKAGIAGAVSASFAIEGFGLSHMFNIKPETAQKRFDKLLQEYQCDNHESID